MESLDEDFFGDTFGVQMSFKSWLIVMQIHDHRLRYVKWWNARRRDNVTSSRVVRQRIGNLKQPNNLPSALLRLC